MREYAAWLKGLPHKPVFDSYPEGFDFMFVYWYLIHFTGESPFSHSALDAKTYTMARLKTAYRESTKRNMPKRWFGRLPNTHNALEDAVEQGTLFCYMLAENLGNITAKIRLCERHRGATAKASRLAVSLFASEEPAS